ncbi:MAG: SpoIIE family protein phosphatase [Gemmataceae bacterium]
MAMLLILQGPEVGRRYPLGAQTVVGRLYESDICLTGQAVSRQHARFLSRDGQILIEDLGSSNGTFLNGVRLEPHVPTPISDRDQVQIGPYVFAPRLSAPSADPPMIVREKVSAQTISASLYGQDPATKLQVVLEIAQNLGRTLDLDPLLDRLLEQVMRLFPQADRALVIFTEHDKLVLRAQRGRTGHENNLLPYSRTVVNRALEEGMALWSEDVQEDARFQSSQTLTALGLHSVLCVPMINPEGKRLGVLQVERFRKGQSFKVDDLHLLTAIAIQVAVVLENLALQAQRLKEERLHRELALARDIQEGFLPHELENFPDADFEILGRLYPARQVAGDLYDYFRLPGGQLAFFIGDVSGKGIPAALFMVMTRTLIRHIARDPGSPTHILARLNDALADDNPSCMFVTLCHGVYEPGSGEVILATAGHPPPLLVKADGGIEAVPLKPGRLLGFDQSNLHLSEFRLRLAPGDRLVFYTDGLTEAREPARREQFGVDRLKETLAALPPELPLAEMADRIRAAALGFAQAEETQDDLTLLLFGRKR